MPFSSKFILAAQQGHSRKQCENWQKHIRFIYTHPHTGSAKIINLQNYKKKRVWYQEENNKHLEKK